MDLADHKWLGLGVTIPKWRKCSAWCLVNGFFFDALPNQWVSFESYSNLWCPIWSPSRVFWFPNDDVEVFHGWKNEPAILARLLAVSGSIWQYLAVSGSIPRFQGQQSGADRHCQDVGRGWEIGSLSRTIRFFTTLGICHRDGMRWGLLATHTLGYTPNNSVLNLGVCWISLFFVISGISLRISGDGFDQRFISSFHLRRVAEGSTMFHPTVRFSSL